VIETVVAPDKLSFTRSIFSPFVVPVLTPSKIDDEYASKFGAFMIKALAFLPTIGINPRTKALEEAYKELKADQTQP